jgi:hypothetical protein
MHNVKIYRKGPAPKKLTKAERAQLDRVLSLTCRVERPALVDFFTTGGFAKLPQLSSQVIDNPGRRILNHADAGWTVPDSDLGRAGVAALESATDARKTAQSILLWIKKNLPMVDASSVSVVVEND